MAVTVGLLGVPGRRRDARGPRAGRGGVAGVRRRGAGVRRARRRLPGADGVDRVAARGAAQAPRRATHAGAADRDRHRAAQPRRGRGDRLRLRGRRARAGRLPRDRLRAAQHDRGARDRRADRRRCARPSAGSRCSACSPARPRSLGAWIGAAAFNASLAAFLFGFGAGAIVQVIVQLAPTLRDDGGRALHPAAVSGILGGMAIMFATGPAGGPDGGAEPRARARPSRTTRRRSTRCSAAPTAAGRDQRPGRAPGRHARVRVARCSRSSPSAGWSSTSRTSGVLLTAEGRRVALEVMRHHRLLELYLAEHLGVPWDRVHEEAEALEHVISEDLEARIAAKLGEPTHDPHGDPIPDADLRIDEGDTRALDGAASRARPAASCASRTPTRRCCATSTSAACGSATRCEVVDRQPFGGPLTVRFGGRCTRSAARSRARCASSSTESQVRPSPMRRSARARASARARGR